ncbi:MAG TPA: hypothetical protein PK720_04435, partial [bacterium]|nr:hypothetical protein [bacterium]
MKNKILSFGLIALLSAVTYPLIATAGLWSYYNQERNQPMPSREVRASYATDIGIENYSGTASQNIALEKYVREVDSWEDRVRAGNLTDEELKQVPERVWKRLVPQVIQVVSPPDSFGEDELGFGMPQAGNIITCRDTDCDKYLTNNEQNLGYSVVS